VNARKAQVWTGIAKGQTNREIAKDLGLSVKTIKSHATALFREIGVSNRTQAAIAAFSSKKVEREEAESCNSTK
jgi:two-component system nitrate/nitrite response regulator NarL